MGLGTQVFSEPFNISTYILKLQYNMQNFLKFFDYDNPQCHCVHCVVFVLHKDTYERELVGAEMYVPSTPLAKLKVYGVAFLCLFVCLPKIVSIL